MSLATVSVHETVSTGIPPVAGGGSSAITTFTANDSPGGAFALVDGGINTFSTASSALHSFAQLSHRGAAPEKHSDRERLKYHQTTVPSVFPASAEAFGPEKSV